MVNSCRAPRPYPEVVLVWASQLGKTSVQLAHLAFIIAEDPGPVLFVEPNLAMVEAVSKDRLGPMFRDVPILQGKVSDPKSRDSGSTIYNRRFIGGQVSLVGSNSPAGLAGRPVRYLELDEVDRFEASAGAEGDPVDLAIARARTFWNRKLVLASSPTVKASSRIEAAWLDSDQREYHLPCPRCKVPQVIEWERVEWPEREPEEAAYRCLHCDQLIPHHEKARMVARGRWIKGNPSSKIAGFRLSELNSPWRTWGDLAVDWLKVQGNPERTRVFWNTSLARWWSDEEQRGTDINTLLARRENYGPELPAGVAALTVGVDVGGDRIELELVGWGRGEESWSVEFRVLPGDPTGAQVWRDLDEYLIRTWKHPKAGTLPVHACCIDSGYHMDRVLAFTRERFGRRVFAVKGKEGERAVWPKKPSRKNGAHFYIVGVDSAKVTNIGRLKIAEPGPGYCHFPADRREAWFEQLLSEILTTKYLKGKPRREWRRKPGLRAEGLDARNYAYAALQALLSLGVNLDGEADRIAELDAPKPSAPMVTRSKWMGG